MIRHQYNYTILYYAYARIHWRRFFYNSAGGIVVKLIAEHICGRYAGPFAGMQNADIGPWFI